MCWCRQEPLPGVTMEDEKKMQRSDIHRCFPQHSAKMVVMPESLESHVKWYRFTWFHWGRGRCLKIKQLFRCWHTNIMVWITAQPSFSAVFKATPRHSLFSSSSKQKFCWSHHYSIEFINLSDGSCSKAYLRTMLTVGTSIRPSLQW